MLTVAVQGEEPWLSLTVTVRVWVPAVVQTYLVVAAVGAKKFAAGVQANVRVSGGLLRSAAAAPTSIVLPIEFSRGEATQDVRYGQALPSTTVLLTVTEPGPAGLVAAPQVSVTSTRVVPPEATSKGRLTP